MRKNKVAFLMLIMIGALLVVSYPTISKKFSHAKDFQNSLELSEGDYIVGKDFPTGTYDFVVTDDRVEILGWELFKNQQVVGMSLSNDNVLSISGSGKVRMEKADFAKIPQEENQYVFSDVGWYQIGKQIPAGSYQVKYLTSMKAFEEAPYVQTSKKNDSIITSSIELTSEYQRIDLVSGETLYLDFQKSNNEEFQVVFEKGKD